MTKNDSQVIQRLKDRISKLEKDNTKDLREMAERGKELVKIASITRGCKHMIEDIVYEKLILVIEKFEKRCT